MRRHRKDKRAQLRQVRDHWYELVEAKYSRRDIDAQEDLATKQDMLSLEAKFEELAAIVREGIENGSMTRHQLQNVASTMVSSISVPASSLSFHSEPPLVLITGTKSESE